MVEDDITEYSNFATSVENVLLSYPKEDDKGSINDDGYQQDLFINIANKASFICLFDSVTRMGLGV